MKYIKLHLYIIIAFCLIISCKKTEYQRAPVGEELQYVDSLTTTLSQYINNSGNLLFKEIWSKSLIESKLGINTYSDYLILLPSEESLRSAGWDEAKINNSSQLELETVIRMHICLKASSFENLNTKDGSLTLNTFYDLPNLYFLPIHDEFNEKVFTPIQEFPKAVFHPLTFTINFYLKNSVDLVINGQECIIDKFVKLKGGFVCEIGVMIDKSNATLKDYISKYPDLSIYYELMLKSDSIYNEKFKIANGYYAKDGNTTIQMNHRDSFKQFNMIIKEHVNGKYYVDRLNTYFLPSNDAFKASGFNSVEDLLSFNNRRSTLNPEWFIEDNGEQYYKILNEFPTDSLLDYHHNWGLKFENEVKFELLNKLLFYNHDLISEQFYHVPIGIYNMQLYFNTTSLKRSETKYYISPFHYQDNKLIFKLTSESTYIKTKNINTLNGILNIVDNLIIHPKMNF